ncbi:MAG: methyltransferase domain-containing protein [Thioalkalivibrio sp.]|nr:methyltransferase domain-containing protein [Thioalkalivibrio sp.]
MDIVIAIVACIAAAFLLNLLSYRILKTRIIRQCRTWDLNICCGDVDGGGLNADIVAQDVPNFLLIPDIYRLPFRDGEFERVLCSHTIEHVDDPDAFWAELSRVGKHVTVILPPLWDLAAAFNIFEHKWIFLSWRKRHHSLPRHIRFSWAHTYQQRFGQVVANSMVQRLRELATSRT